MRRFSFFLSMVAAGSIGCGSRTPPAPPPQGAGAPAEVIPPVVVEPSLAYLEVSEEEAEAILTVEVSIPGVVEKDPHRFPLKRGPQEGEHTKTARGSGMSHGFAADGRAEDGRGFGYGGSISLSGGSPGKVAVGLHFSWTRRDGQRGDLAEDVEVPWLGATRKELGNGASVRLSFSRPAK